MEFIQDIKNYINDKWQDFMTSDKIIKCPSCQNKNIASYPTTICYNCKHSITSLREPVPTQDTTVARVSKYFEDLFEGYYVPEPKPVQMFHKKKRNF